MRTARLFIYGLPVLLIALILAAFANSVRLSTDKKNEMSLGVMGEYLGRMYEEVKARPLFLVAEEVGFEQTMPDGSPETATRKPAPPAP